jgi:hypothetical protein
MNMQEYGVATMNLAKIYKTGNIGVKSLARLWGRKTSHTTDGCVLGWIPLAGDKVTRLFWKSF